MPNGYARRFGSKFGRGTKRTHVARYIRHLSASRGKKARASKVAQLRSTTGRKKAIKSNTNAIARLKREMYGPIQVQRTYSPHFNVVSSRPVCFQLNNCGYGAGSPALLRETTHGNHVEALGRFEKVNYQEDTMQMFANEEDHIANGPKLFLKYVELQFKITGFVQCTHIRIDIVRQKRTVDGDIWNPNDAKSTFMPHLLPGFKNLAGYTVNEIDRSSFEILQTKRIYMNSRASSNLADAAQDRPTSEATTAPQKICTMRIDLNKEYKQLKSSVNEQFQTDDYQGDIHQEDGDESVGSYSYDNQHPLANVWCVISTDDTTAFGSIVDGDAVGFDIFRKCVWRDRVA